MMMKLRSSMLILFIITSIISSVVEASSFEDLKRMQRFFNESSEYITKVVRDKDAVIFAGAAGSGKSTLINYLAGNASADAVTSTFSPVMIRKIDRLSEGPEIKSTYTIPTRWVSAKLPNLDIWDSPEFDDNKPPIDDIATAFCMQQLLQNIKSLRVVLVVDINDILTDNIQPFISVLNKVSGLLRYDNKTYSSILTVIFTKVPDTLNSVPVDIELINSLLSRKFLGGTIGVSETVKNIVVFLINNNSIGLFKRAKLDKVILEMDVNIVTSINSSAQLARVYLNGYRPTVSYKSESFLFRSKAMLLNEWGFSDLEKVMSFEIDKMEVDMQNMQLNDEAESKIWAHITRLYVIQRQLNTALAPESDVFKKMDIIQSLGVNIKQKIEEHRFIEKIQLLELVDKLLGMEESNTVGLSLQRVLLCFATKVKRTIASAMVRQAKINSNPKK